MHYVLLIALVIGVIWFLAQFVAFLVAIAAIPAAVLAAPSVAAMRLLNASLGLTSYDAGLYVLLHGLLGGAVGLSAHMMVRRFRLEGTVRRALRFTRTDPRMAAGAPRMKRRRDVFECRDGPWRASQRARRALPNRKERRFAQRPQPSSSSPDSGRAVASRSVIVLQGSGGLTVIAEKRLGNAGPPSREETNLLRETVDR